MKKYLIMLVLVTPLANANDCRLLAAYAETLRYDAIIAQSRLVPYGERKAFLEQARAESKAKYEADKSACK